MDYQAYKSAILIAAPAPASRPIAARSCVSVSKLDVVNATFRGVRSSSSSSLARPHFSALGGPSSNRTAPLRRLEAHLMFIHIYTFVPEWSKEPSTHHPRIWSAHQSCAQAPKRPCEADIAGKGKLAVELLVNCFPSPASSTPRSLRNTCQVPEHA